MAILFPVIITTEKALENALSEKYGVIYIDDSLYAQNAQWLQRCMTRHGYFLAEKRASTECSISAMTGAVLLMPRKSMTL